MSNQTDADKHIRKLSAEDRHKLIAACSHFGAAIDSIADEARGDELFMLDNLGAGDTIYWLADGLRLVIEAVHPDDERFTALLAAARGVNAEIEERWRE